MRLVAMHGRVIRHDLAAQCFQRQRRNQRRLLEQPLGMIDDWYGDTHHRGGAVNHRKAFLVGKPRRLEAGTFQCFFARHDFALVPRAPRAGHDECNVCERSEVATCTQGTLLGYTGNDAGVVYGDVLLEVLGTDRGDTAAQGVYPAKHRSPHIYVIEVGTDVG